MLTTLVQGARGTDVFVLQAQLNLANSASIRLAVDGIFGPLTLRRVLEFQRAAKLTADGIVGPRTWAGLAQVKGTEAESVPALGCDNGNPANSAKTVALTAAVRNFAPAQTGNITANFIGGGAGLTPLVGSKFESTARGVYGNSLDYGNIYLSSQVGLEGRCFTLAVPVPPTFRRFIQVLNLGSSPSNDDLIHELGHAWQSQHHSSATAYAANCIACQAAAVAANTRVGKLDPTVTKHSRYPVNYPMSAYAYRPGATFERYAGEQIAQQIENGEAGIRTRVSAVAAGSNDAANVKSVDITNIKIEDRRDAGVKM